jgi:Ca2+-transporting ATPase
VCAFLVLSGSQVGRWVWGQLSDPMNIMLLIVCVASFAIAQVATGVVVLGLVTFNVVMGSSQELKARASVEALAQLQVPRAPVRPSGQVAEVESTELVPGDVVLVEAGGVVPADGRIVSSATLGVQEAALTGESAPIPRTGWPFSRARSRSATGCIRSRAWPG